MGCGGSKEILEGCEKPLCHKMETIEIDSIDSIFAKSSTIICQVEEKRKFLCDELMDHYYHTGGWAYTCPDPQKALECCVWRLGADNKGKVTDIGLNVEGPNFEGASNSEAGNQAANNLIGYMKCLATDWKMEDMTSISDQLGEIVTEITSNMDTYAKEIGDHCSSNPMKMMSCMSMLKKNLAKATCAVNCIKDLITKMKELCACAPGMMASCSPDKLLGQQGHVEKAFKSKQTCNLSIAWCVINADVRRGKTCKAADEEYCCKLKARKECLAKMAA